MILKEVRNFQYGLFDKVDQAEIPDGAASRSLNWLTKKSHIELRRGYAILGNLVTGSGAITGLIVGKRDDGTEIPIWSRGRKIEYYHSTTDARVELGTNQLPTAANGEDVSFDAYHNLAGAWVYASSPNSSIYKIATANLGATGSILDLATTNFKGKIRIKQGRMLLWDRLGNNGRRDATGLYLSYIDKDELSDYTETTGFSVGTGNGTDKTFTATLTLTSTQTAFGCEVTDGTETFSDDYNGVLVGSLGGTGTINYITGAISVTFNTAPANLQAITARYYREDSTSAGIADFSHSTPRTAGQGAIFRQDDGGGVLQNVFSINDVEYCLHETKTWALTITATDTAATNLIFRGRVGIPNWRAAAETGTGIYYIDDTDENDPKFRHLTFAQGSTELVPISISSNVNLSDYRFNKGACIEYGDFVLFACRHKDSTDNNKVFVFNKLYGTFDVLDYYVSAFAIYNGALLGGDSVSNNVYTLFSGLDDDGALIANYWEGNLSDLDIQRLKKLKRLNIQGAIGPDQKIKVLLSYDRGAFVEVGGSDSGGVHTYAIQGNGSYVDKSQSVDVGSLTLGRGEIGGGGLGITAYNFEKEIKIRSDKFKEVKIKFEAVGIGWAQISTILFNDIRALNQKTLAKYR